MRCYRYYKFYEVFQTQETQPPVSLIGQTSSMAASRPRLEKARFAYNIEVARQTSVVPAGSALRWPL